MRVLSDARSAPNKAITRDIASLARTPLGHRPGFWQTTGWKEYFCLAETPRVLSDLDEWIRHRLRMVQLKQWKRGKTIYREMTRLGAAGDVARRVAANSRRWWKNSAKLLHTGLPNSYYDRMGVPRLAT